MKKSKVPGVVIGEFLPQMWRAQVDTTDAPSGLAFLAIAVWSNGVDGKEAFAVHVSGALKAGGGSPDVLTAWRATFEEACDAGRRIAAVVLRDGFSLSAEEAARC